QPYEDRRHAGDELGARLRHLKGRPDVVELALPRGGFPVAYEVARALDAPLDIFLVRKLGLPGHRELAMGAIASGGVRVLNDDVVSWYRVPQTVIDDCTRGTGRAGASRADVSRRPRPSRAQRASRRARR